MRNPSIFKTAGAAAGAIAAMLAAPAFAADGPAVTDQSDIIVTATKRPERIMQVAIPMSAVTGDQLAKANANSLADYITRLPGVVFNDYQPGVSEVVIRGVAATTYHEQGQTTVGYYLNEVQIVEPGFPIGIPDIDTFDLDRVEVLRGPQGTLYGASTLGGLVNYVAKTADVSKIDAAASASVGTVKNASHDLDYSGKMMVNMPIIQDKLAVRVMALQRHDAGYLDNIATGKKGANDFRTRGIRGSVVFQPFDGTKITYLGTYQDTKLDDQTYLSEADKLVRDTPRAEPQKTSFFLNSLRLDQELGDVATLTVLGSIDKKTNYTVFTDPYYYITGNTTGQAAAYGPTHAHANIKTIEARLSSASTTSPFHWLIGASYLYATKYSYDQIFQQGAESYINANPALFSGYTGAQLAPGDRIYGYIGNSRNKDFGVFGELSYKPVPQLEITVGGRYYHTEAAGSVVNQAGALGAYAGGYHLETSGSVDQKDSGFTPKATIAFRPNGKVMFYATYSRGYRVGGINPNAGLLPSIPTAYASDKVDNYEVGVKATLLHGRVVIDADVFNIDWKNIQARLFGPGPSYYSYVTNAGGANIVGLEFAGTVHLTRQLSFSSNVTLQDGTLTKFLPDTFAAGGGYAPGSTLPGSSKWSIANNVVLDLADLPHAPTLEFAHRYLSKAPVAFGSTFMRGGYNLFDLRASFSLAPKVRVLGYVDNVTNKYGILSGPFASDAVPAYSITRPRNFGLRVDWSL